MRRNLQVPGDRQGGLGGKIQSDMHPYSMYTLPEGFPHPNGESGMTCNNSRRAIPDSGRRSSSFSSPRRAMWRAAGNKLKRSLRSNNGGRSALLGPNNRDSSGLPLTCTNRTEDQSFGKASKERSRPFAKDQYSKTGCRSFQPQSAKTILQSALHMVEFPGGVPMLAILIMRAFIPPQTKLTKHTSPISTASS